MSLKDKVVVVTGGNGNLGRALARAASSSGARVVLLDLRFTDSNSLAHNAREHVVDLLSQEDTQRCFEGLGPVDVLCNVAGGFDMGERVHEISEHAWSKMFNMNVWSLLNAVASVVPSMAARGNGKIINVGAAAGLAGRPLMGAYSAAKAAVVRLTESMSHELRHNGVNVNCVLPGIIDTAQNREAMPNADFSTWVRAEDIAEVMCFLASDKAKAIHGAAIPVTNLS